MMSTALADVTVIKTDAPQIFIQSEEVLEDSLAVSVPFQIVLVDDCSLHTFILRQSTQQRIRSIQVEATVRDVEILELRFEHETAGDHFDSLVAEWVATEVEPLDLRELYRVME